MSWTDERIATLKKMWKEGKSAADIAKTLGKVTRNAVIGKAHRMGLSGRPSPIKKPTAAPKAKETAAKKPVLRSVKKPLPVAASTKKLNPLSSRPEVEEPKFFEKEAVPEGGGIPLIELTERMCKWPIGDPRDADFIFCGLGIRVGTPYCPGHAAMAYQTSSRGRPAAAAAAAAAAKVKVVAAAAASEDDEEIEDVVEDDDAAEDDEA